MTEGLIRLARKVVELAAPPAQADFLIGDLDERLRRVEGERGRTRAALWYWGEALRSIGPLLTYPERWRGGAMLGIGQDLKGALRLFRRAPGFSAVVVGTLAVGVGGVASVYSVVRGVLLSPLPFEDPDRVVMLWAQSPEYPRAPLTVGDYNELAREVGSFADVSAAWSNNALVLDGGDAEQVSVGWVTPEYFDVLGVSAAIGRTLEPQEENAVVLSNALWERRFGADPGVIGETMDLNGERFEIVGVLPRDRNPNLTTFSGGLAAHQVWRIQPPSWMVGDDRSVGWLRANARLAEGVSLEAAQSEVDALMTRINATITERDGGVDTRIRLIPAKSDLVGAVSRTLWILFAAVVGVLLIAASNVANLVLARGEERSGEVAVRTALGGTRSRLIRLLVVESSVLALIGGALGILVAWAAMPVLLSLAPASLPRLDAIELDASVVLLALAATAGASVIFAIVPALKSTRADLSTVLGDRSVTMDRRRRSLSRALIVGEVALSLALVTATGLLIRSVGQLESVDLGFEKEGILTFTAQLPSWGGSNEEAAVTMQSLLDGMSQVPGVRAAGFTNRIPLAGGLFTGDFRTEEMMAADVPSTPAAIRFVSPDYIEALGGRLISGRMLNVSDGLDRVVIDQLAAERSWPGQAAVGRRVEVSAIGEDPQLAEVIGVVAPIRHHGVADAAEPTVYMPILAIANQQNFRAMAVRVEGDPTAYVEPLREAARRVQGDAVLARIQTTRELFDEDIAATRFAALLLSAFGAVALLLAAVGLHGVMAFSVRRRSREIGIRVVLGAERGAVLRDAVGSAAGLVLLGIALGTTLSLGLGQILQSLLFGVDANDFATLAASAGIMALVGLAGAWLPARLVLSLDPATTLREE